MGVDISAYSNVKFIQSYGDTSENQEDQFYDDGNKVSLWVDYFIDHADGLEGGWYSFDEEMDVMSRSYGGYGIWRRQICTAVYGTDIEKFWQACAEEPETMKESSFYWLLHFSDCEGFIGPDKCSILLRDFKKFADILKEEMTSDKIWNDKPHSVDDWITALELVSGNGVIKYS